MHSIFHTGMTRDNATITLFLSFAKGPTDSCAPLFSGAIHYPFSTINCLSIISNVKTVGKCRLETVEI
jgi:hypothetical protein